jgi:transcriptional regulator with XRE-family HTH domain
MIREDAAPVATAEEAGRDPGVAADGTTLDVERLLASMSDDGSATTDGSKHSLDDLQAAYAHACGGTDQVRALELGIQLQSAYAVAEAHAERAAVLEEVLALLPCQGSPELQVVLRTKLASTLLCEHRLTDAQAVLATARAQVEHSDLARGPWHAQVLEVVVRTLRASHVLGDPLEAAVRQLLDVARGSGSTEAQSRAHWLASRAYAAMGDGATAEHHLAAAERLLSTPALPLRVWFAFCVAAVTVLLDVGADLERVRPWLSSAERAAEALGGGAGRTCVEVLLARCDLRSGRPSEALAMLESLLSDVPALALTPDEIAHVRFLRGQALHHLERWDAAAEALRAVATEAEAAGNLHLAVQAWRELDRLRDARRSTNPSTMRRGGTEEFRALLRHHRKRAGQTQQQLADLAALSLRAVRNLELGRSVQPRRETVQLLADALRLEGRARAEFEAAAGYVPTSAYVKRRFGAGVLAPPHPLGAIVGRDPEVFALTRALRSGQRLVTLVGLPGVGKTRLATEVAVTLHATVDMPVLWRAASTPSVGAHDPDCLRRAVAAGLDALLGGDGTTAVEELQQLVGRSASLLVLDGCDAGTLRCDRLVALLEACPGLRALVTAPRGLGIPGEQTVPVGPLPVPEPSTWQSVGQVGDAPAVQLLLRHARQVSPVFALTPSDAPVVAELCDQVDGFPAALAAVASWLRFYEPAALLQELRRDPFRYLLAEDATGPASRLREVLARTLAALAPTDATLVAALAAEDEDWTVARAVRRADGDPGEYAETVRRLLEQGFVRRVDGPEPRFRVLNLVRHLSRSD